MKELAGLAVAGTAGAAWFVITGVVRERRLRRADRAWERSHPRPDGREDPVTRADLMLPREDT